MVHFCCVYGCSSRRGRDHKSFYRLPAVTKHQGEQTLELTTKRRNEWLSNINRGKVPDSTANNFRVCSDHFHNGNDNKII